MDILGSDVIPVLRKELAAKATELTPAAPTHEARVKAKYGDSAPREARPRANRGDNLTDGSPYQDAKGSSFGPLGRN